jgi:hypothetical protein
LTNRNGSPWSASQALAWIICQKPLRLENQEWTSDMGPQLQQAQRKLAAAIASGEVRAWGRREPHGLLEQIPRDPFCISGLSVIVGEHGDMRPLLPQKNYGGPHWQSIEFDADQIRGAFPEPTPPSVLDWMRNNALNKANKKKKRADLVKECMATTGCKQREAKAAYQELPDTLRRTRGKPARNSE